MFLLGIKSGFRITELLSLRVGDVWRDGKALERVEVARKNMKRKRESRSVPLHPVAAKAVKAWLRREEGRGDLDSSRPLFPSDKDGSRPITRGRAWQILKKAYKDAGLSGKLGTHSLRKMFAARVYQLLKNDLVLTGKALGHASINSTILYLGFDQTPVDEAILRT
jgi:integrase